MPRAIFSDRKQNALGTRLCLLVKCVSSVQCVFQLKCVYVQTWLIDKHTFHRKRVLTNTVENVCFSESVLSNTFISLAVC